MRRRSRRDCNVVLHPGFTSLLPDGIRHAMIVPTLIKQSDLQERPPDRRPGDPLRVMYAGRLTLEKGVGRIMLLWQRCRDAGLHVEFAIAGDGPMRAEVQGAAMDGTGLVYLGNLGSRALQEAIRSAHVMALLSDSEGMPKILWEGWSAGVPMLATPVGGLKDVVQDGEDGALVEADDVCGQLEFVRLMEGDDALRRAMGANAIKSVGCRTRDRQLELLAERLRSWTAA